jgi:hypothetical protein
MFFLVQRTDTMPEQRALVNSDHIVALLPIAGGSKSKVYLTTGDAWEIVLPFAHVVALFRNEAEVINAVPTERARGQVIGTAPEPQIAPAGGFQGNPGLRRQPGG